MRLPKVPDGASHSRTNQMQSGAASKDRIPRDMMKKPAVPSAKLRALLTKTCLCDGTGWTCRLHTLRAMGHESCGEPGTRCRCNPEAIGRRDDYGGGIGEFLISR
jgi:hypothetical protein